jgi:hypothetical protein
VKRCGRETICGNAKFLHQLVGGLGNIIQGDIQGLGMDEFRMAERSRKAPDNRRKGSRRLVVKGSNVIRLIGGFFILASSGVR